MHNQTLIVFHRGGGKSLDYAPNCLVTFKWAVSFGAKAVEYDVVYCKENDEGFMVVVEPQLIKENNLNINNLQWKDVAALDTGNTVMGLSRVAKFNTVFELFQGAGISQQIHIKGGSQRTVATLVGNLRSTANILVTSFDLNTLDKVHEANRKVPIGWIVKPDNTSASEGGEDLTKLVSAHPEAFEMYNEEEIRTIILRAKQHKIDTIILCGPRVREKKIVTRIQSEGIKVGAWGVGSNVGIGKTLIASGIDRFTIDNPEELFQNL